MHVWLQYSKECRNGKKWCHKSTFFYLHMSVGVDLKVWKNWSTLSLSNKIPTNPQDYFPLLPLHRYSESQRNLPEHKPIK